MYSSINIKVSCFYDKNGRSERNYVLKAMEKLSIAKFSSWVYVSSKTGYFGSEIAAKFKLNCGQKECSIFKEYFDGNTLLDNIPEKIRLYIALNNLEYSSQWETFNNTF